MTDGEYDTQQALQHLQGGAGPGVPAGVLHGVWGTAVVRAGRDAGGGRESRRSGWAYVARMLQIRDAWLLATARLAPERIKGNVFDGRKHPLKHLFKSTYMTFAISSLFKNLNIV